MNLFTDWVNNIYKYFITMARNAVTLSLSSSKNPLVEQEGSAIYQFIDDAGTWTSAPLLPAMFWRVLPEPVRTDIPLQYRNN
jgi:hypothetical protein